LDLSQVALVSSAGMRVLHNIFMMLRQDQSGQDEQTVKMGIASGSYTSPHLKLLKPSEAVQRALRVAGFDMFLEIHQDYKKALASF
jgi:anti-anti-sigma regulatory factor